MVGGLVATGWVFLFVLCSQPFFRGVQCCRVFYCLGGHLLGLFGIMGVFGPSEGVII